MIIEIISNYVNLTKKHNSYIGLCPFHDDTKASLFVSETKKGYKCFACGASGGPIKFVQAIDKLSEADARLKINQILGYEALKINVDLKIDVNAKIRKDALEIFKLYLTGHKDKTALEYLTSRKINEETIKLFELGYVSDISSSEMCSYINQKSKNSNQLINNKELQEVGLLTVLNDGNYISSFSNRIIFPIIDQDFKIIGFTGRDINNNSNIKYLNSKNLKKDEFIYGLNLLDDTIEDLVICEGMFDCLTLKQLKLNAISFMGIEYTAKQLSLLKLFTNLRRINICFDNDIAGIKAAIKLASDLKKVFSDISIRFFDYYQIDAKDINEIYNLDEPMLLERLSRFVDYTTFYLNYLISDHKLNRNQKLQVLEKMSIKNSLYKNLMLQRLNECEFYEITDRFIDHVLLKDLILKNENLIDGFLFEEIKNIYKIK